MSIVENVRSAMVFTTARLVFISIPLFWLLKLYRSCHNHWFELPSPDPHRFFTSITPSVPAATCHAAVPVPSLIRRKPERESVRESWTLSFRRPWERQSASSRRSQYRSPRGWESGWRERRRPSSALAGADVRHPRWPPHECRPL